MGQFMHQRAASRPARAGHGIIQQVAAQVMRPANARPCTSAGRSSLQRTCTCAASAQQAIRQQGLHVGQGLHRHLLLCRAQPCRIQLRRSAACAMGGQQ
jgi:hypothetical protein